MYQSKLGKTKLCQMLLAKYIKQLFLHFKRIENGALQRFRSELADREKEIEALHVSHAATIEKMHLVFKAKEAELIAENERLKNELLQTKMSLEAAHITISVQLKNTVEM